MKTVFSFVDFVARNEMSDSLNVDMYNLWYFSSVSDIKLYINLHLSP